MYNQYMTQKRFCIRIDQGMVDNRALERLRAIADKRKRSVAFLVKEALLDYVESQESKRLSID